MMMVKARIVGVVTKKLMKSLCLLLLWLPKVWSKQKLNIASLKVVTDGCKTTTVLSHLETIKD